MKSLSKTIINQACQRYIDLKSDKVYQSYYKAYISLNFLAQNPCFEAENVCVSLEAYILSKWDLKFVISPFFRIRIDHDLDTTSKSVQLILGAFGVIDENPLIYAFLTRIAHRKGHKISKAKTETEIRTLKLLTYLLRDNLKMNTRQISRLLTIDKSTVDPWASIIAELPEPERKAIIYELTTGRQLKEGDVMDNSHRLTLLHDNIEPNDTEKDDELS